MGQLKIGIVEGWTAAMDFQLFNDGVSQTLSGMAVSTVLRNRLAATVALAGSIAILDATQGTVRLLPTTADFRATDEPYTLRFAVADSTTTNGSARTAYWPNDEPILVTVRP